MYLECVLWLLACCALLNEKINYFFKLSIVRTYSFCSSLVVFSLRSNDLAKLDSTSPYLGRPCLHTSPLAPSTKARGFSGSSSQDL